MEKDQAPSNFFVEVHNRLVQEGILSTKLELPVICYQNLADSRASQQEDRESYPPVSYNDWWSNLLSCWSLSDGGQRLLSQCGS